MSLCRSPSAFSVSGSACRRACSSGFQPHRAQRSGASFAYGQALPCFGSPHASRKLSFFSGMLDLLDLNPEFGPHEFAVPQILLCPRRLCLHIFDDELAAEFVRKVRRVPDRADPLPGLCHIRFL